MPHETSLIIAISAGVGLAFVLGAIAAKLKLPPLLGYLLAGLAVGPFTPGIVADGAVAHQLSEIGVTLLMFGVGLHFSIKDLKAVRNVALPGALLQIVVATSLGLLAAMLMGMSFGAGLLFGICLSVASTVVLLRALEDRGDLETANGRIAVGWLVVEDIVTIVAIVLLPVLASTLGGKAGAGESGSLLQVLVITSIKIAGFAGVMLVVGKRLLPTILGSIFRDGPRELFTVGVVAVALGIAFGASSLLGISPALGAFLAGVVIAESDISHQTSSEVKPLATIFAVLFFVSIGMLFDPSALVRYPGEVLIGLGIVLFGKSLASAGIMLLLRYPPAAAMMVSASLAQIGELSFILAGLGLKLQILNQSAMSIILAVGVLSIALNPLMFHLMGIAADYVEARFGSGEEKAAVEGGQGTWDAHSPTRLQNHVVMVGYGRVGRIISFCFERARVPHIVIDFDRTIIAELEARNIPAYFGDATRPSDLSHVNLEEAKLLVVATPANSQAREIVGAARVLRPDLPICVRTHSVEDYSYFEEQSIQRAVLGELETAIEMAEFAFRSTGEESRESREAVEMVRARPGIELEREPAAT